MIEINGIVIEDSERQPCEVWTRCMGYHRPISQFNIGKKQEHKDRVPFKAEEKELDAPDKPM